MEFLEALCAVAALQQERLAGRDLREISLQLARLAREHERRVRTELLLDARQSCRIGVIRRDVLGWERAPPCGGPFFLHRFEP